MDCVDYQPPYHTVVPLPLLAPILRYIHYSLHVHSYLLSEVQDELIVSCSDMHGVINRVLMQAPKFIIQKCIFGDLGNESLW